ncbi:MAG: molybdopterin molybdotransferase MoeA [Candidatus Saccharibacteria bacterium]|nr:molybdopterin molybdotransferase MoeA [Moraxellaceae bacterium]
MQTQSSSLLPVDQLISRLIEDAYQVSPESETCLLGDALGRVLSAPIISLVDVPPFDNSAMDGYALNWQPDLQNKMFPVSGVSPAGQRSGDLKLNTAVRILTGAPIPKGANTVIMQENVTCNESDDISTIVVNVQPQAHENIRRASQDIAKGAMVFPSGTRLGAAEIGLLASIGIVQVSVHRQLRVSVIATGDELVEAGKPLIGGQIYNSNTPLLTALLKMLHVQMIRAVQVPDQPEKLKELLSLASTDSDLILTTGGASVGDADHLKDVLTQIGRIENWKIAIKPGKPLVWGEVVSHLGQHVPMIGLPGNPQSVWVTFLIVVMPYLKALQGQRTRLLPQSVKVPAGFIRKKPQGRREYLRVQLVDGQLIQHPNQSSGALMSASWADGFAIIETGMTVEKGEYVSYIPMSGILCM